jgi:hypothetical protein
VQSLHGRSGKVCTILVQPPTRRLSGLAPEITYIGCVRLEDTCICFPPHTTKKRTSINFL